ncbi:MAG: hypothetical protein ACK5G7_04510, partial [Erysipelotrichaceae bacterium]
LMAMSPKGYLFINVTAYFLGALVSFVIVALFLINDKSEESEAASSILQASEEVMNNINGNNTAEIEETERLKTIKKITFACDAGMGSSVMGVSILKTKLAKAQVKLEVEHCSIDDIGSDVELIITSKVLEGRVKEAIIHKYNKEVEMIIIDNLLSHDEYDQIVQKLKQMSN